MSDSMTNGGGGTVAASLALLCAVTMIGPGGLGAQAGQDGALDEAVQHARQAWLTHDIEELVSGSDTVRLGIPGIAASASLRPGQAERLLDQYLKPSDELRLELKDIRKVAADHAYVEVGRVYVVRGTTEQREETVFLGFRLIGDRWRLREVRVTP